MNQGHELHEPKMQGQPPPYSSMPPQPANAAPIHVVHHTNAVPAIGVIPVVVGQQMGPNSSVITCVSCRQEIATRVETKSTLRTHLFAALLCLIGCWPCVFIPYCVDSCKNKNHYCPNCNAYLGSYIS